MNKEETSSGKMSESLTYLASLTDADRKSLSKAFIPSNKILEGLTSFQTFTNFNLLNKDLKQETREFEETVDKLSRYFKKSK